MRVSVLLSACVLLLLVSLVAASPLLERLAKQQHAHDHPATKPHHPKPAPTPKHPHEPKPHHPKPHTPKPHHPSPPAPAPAPHSPTAPAETCSKNGVAGTCMDINTCISVGGRTAVEGLCSGVASNQCCMAQAEPQPGCGSAALARALTWVRMEVLYCQSANGQPDGDNACASVCHRASNRDWNAYRSDCSGFVSYAYGLPAPGRTTGEFAPYVNDVSFKLASPNDLRPGDVINSTPHEHIMIFREWLNADHTQASFLEEPGCSDAHPYAKRTDTAVAISGDTIKLQVNGMSFYAVRFNSNRTPC